ncbi:hypothetical protein FS842_011244 [Serendipita sp. 407]|nr:hypothetical protein FRC20_001783 [Serendipita sp. 405]KAG9051211.1 hypothetical protein FS842_011244 [Serendipita sp. 407]
MPDPLQVLSYDVWVICIQLAIHGQPTGPLELMMVSRRWKGALLDTPLLWSRIQLQSTEDELGRVRTFLRLSKECPLDIDIVATLSTEKTLRLIQPHLSRVKSVSIRPDLSHHKTVVHRQQWLGVASFILATFFNQITPPNVQISHSGMYRTEDTQMQYYPNLIQFESTTKAEDTNRNESWGLSGEERGDESQTRDASGSRIIWDEILSK